MRVAAAVAETIAANGPVVALESTIIAHGFPSPRNREVAAAMEGAVTDGGALGATIGVLDGDLVVGMDGAELDRIAFEPMAKVNTANLAFVMADGGSGATTVSATTRAAALAGIAVMATGGIGGVHRTPPTDVSADLAELARHPLGVVSSGAKSFLDLPATLQYLETAGIGVVGYGTDEFPAFYSRSSGLPLAHVVETPQAAAALIATSQEIEGSAVLIANPIPADAALEPDEVAALTAEARARADEAGVDGPERSPFVLAAMAEISGGRTVEANAALATANATLAAQIAVALSQ